MFGSFTQHHIREILLRNKCSFLYNVEYYSSVKKPAIYLFILLLMDMSTLSYFGLSWIKMLNRLLGVVCILGFFLNLGMKLLGYGIEIYFTFNNSYHIYIYLLNSSLKSCVYSHLMCFLDPETHEPK